MTFSYRLRFRANIGIAIPERTVELVVPGLSRSVLFRASSGTLEKSPWFYAQALGFQSEEEAKSEGRQLANALTLTGVRGKLGIDTGEHGLSQFRGVPLEDDELDSSGSSAKQLGIWLSLLSESLVLVPSLCKRQMICASMLNDSFYLHSPDARFVVRVSAIEALCDQKNVSKSLIDLADELISNLSKMPVVDEDDRETLRRRIEREKKESIRSAYMTKIRLLIGHQAAKDFDALYNKRSRYLHDGIWRGSLITEAEQALDLASELLFAELRAGVGGSDSSQTRSSE